MTKKIVIANWKMLPATLAEAQEILARIDEWLSDRSSPPDIVVCPPFVFLDEVHARLGEGSLNGAVSLGAQDVTDGAQLVALGVRYVIIGHSDRRWKLNESDEVVNQKLKGALTQDLVPVICIGERTREGDWKGELAAQVDGTLAGLTAQSVARCIIAYEPVWAISTNPGAKPDTPASAVQSMGIIRERISAGWEVSPLFIYGGSVNAENAREFLERPEIRGVLVGGASVRADDFDSILKAAASVA